VAGGILHLPRWTPLIRALSCGGIPLMTWPEWGRGNLLSMV